MFPRQDRDPTFQAGENVVAAIGAQITELKAGIDAQGARIEAQITELNAQSARIERSPESDLTRDLAAHRSAGRSSYLQPAPHGAHPLGIGDPAPFHYLVSLLPVSLFFLWFRSGDLSTVVVAPTTCSLPTCLNYLSVGVKARKDPEIVSG